MPVTVYTYQDFLETTNLPTFIIDTINAHKATEAYRIALDADAYDRQENTTINGYARMLYNFGVSTDPDTGERVGKASKVEDKNASNNKIASNFFNRLNTQRVQYSMGNGISFVQPDEDADSDKTKEALGPNADHVLSEAAYYACIHGVSFVFWNYDRLHEFTLTEFAPLYDENTGALRAGVRFWQLDSTRPLNATLYTEDGYSNWRQDSNSKLSPLDRDGEFAETEVRIPYKETTGYIPADDELVIMGGENYGTLPIVPMWTSRLKQSTLIGMKSAIDAYDLVKSGFANDLQDCATVFWIVKNAGGMSQSELAEFRDRLRLEHIAKVDGFDGADAQPYTQEIPHAARTALLKELRDGIYEDFGALDVHTVAAGATNDHIDAAYQPMDENASDFEYWVGECIGQILNLAGIEDTPVFTRNRISNQLEQVQMVVQEAQWLDQATILRKLPNIRPDEVAAILQRMDDEDMARFSIAPAEPDETAPTGGGEPAPVI